MSSERPLGRHDLTEAEKQQLRAEAEERYRAEVEAELRQASGSQAPTAPIPPAPTTPPKPQWQINAEAQAAKEAERRAALTPEQRQREDQRNRKALIAFAVVMLPVSFVLLRACGSDYLQSRAANKARAEAEAARSLTLAGQSPYFIREACLSSVRDKLKAPSTARFEDDGLPQLSGGVWMWDSHVDAQNSFGAQIRTDFTCVVEGTTPEDATVRTLLLDN